MDSHIIPEDIFVIVDTRTGNLKTGGGSSTPAQTRVFPSRKDAERSLSRIGCREGLEIIQFTLANGGAL